MSDQYPVDADAGEVRLDTSIPAAMPAAVVRELPTRHLELEAVPTPRIEAPDHLLLRVEACGICGTDLHILAGTSYRPTLPFVLGHEAVGTVVDAGSDATSWVGRRVTMTNFTGCGRCAMCRAGDERLCPDLVSITGVLGAWGGFAGYVRIHAAQAVDVPSPLDAIAAASLVDAGVCSTDDVWHAIARQNHDGVTAAEALAWAPTLRRHGAAEGEVLRLMDLGHVGPESGHYAKLRAALEAEPACIDVAAEAVRQTGIRMFADAERRALEREHRERVTGRVH